MESAPVSASSSAARGTTGLDQEPTKPQSVFRRHPLASGIAAAVVAVVVVSGLTAWGVGAAVTASLTSSTASVNSTMPMGTPTTAPQAGNTKGGGAATGRLAFRATIQSMNGDSWTILTKRGQTVTVAIDSTTQFGTKKALATAGSFSVGDSVVIVAMRGTGGTPTATRVVDASVLGGTTTTPTPSMTTTPNA
jgi:Domain of unknown function (DUF5666)